MREIKYRAWDKRVNVMCGIGWIRWNPDLSIKQAQCIIQYESPNDINEYLQDGDNLTFLQFTGLHDKNRKEVWEGDIVHVDRLDSFSSYNKATIIYAENRGSFFLQYTKLANPKGILSMESIHSNDGTVIFDNCTGWDIEVIGNIYENPELTEGKK